GFATSGHPGIYLEQNSGKLYVYATRATDSTGGVVCIDTTTAANNPNPFCGFTTLTAPGESPLVNGISALSMPLQAGGRLYAFNYAPGLSAGAANHMLCFDLTTHAACASQPF